MALYTDRAQWAFHTLPAKGPVDKTFACPPRDPASAFVPLGPVDLDTILCHEEERVVAQNNTVCLEPQVPQIAPQPAGGVAASCASPPVRHHPSGLTGLLPQSTIPGTPCRRRSPVIEAQE